MSDYDPENPLSGATGAEGASGADEPESATPIRRVGRRDRKRQIKADDKSGLFDTLNDGDTSVHGDASVHGDTSVIDDEGMIEPVTALPDMPGRPLPDDEYDAEAAPLEGDFVLEKDDRFPPVVIPRSSSSGERRTRRTRARGEARTDIDRSQPMAQKRRVGRHDRVALLFLLATIAVAGYFVYLWQNPYSLLNPLAPERPVIYVTATPGPGTADATGASDSGETGATGDPVYPYAVRDGVQLSALADQCGQVVITGLIDGSGQETAYAVRASGGDQDEGVITTYVTEAGAQVYLINLPMPDAPTIYLLQLYDLVGQALSAEVPVQITPGCTANRASVNFAPRG